MASGNYLHLISPYTDKFYTISQSYLLAAGGGQLPDVLQEAQIRVLELADCQERYSSTPYQVYDESICVFKLTDGDDHTGSCYVSIQTLAVARPSVGLESYIGVQTLAMVRPSTGIEPAVVLTVTARNKQEKTRVNVSDFEINCANTESHSADKNLSEHFRIYLDLEMMVVAFGIILDIYFSAQWQKIIDEKSNSSLSRQS